MRILLTSVLILGLLCPAQSATRADAQGDNYVRTTNLPTATSWTIMFWFKMAVDRNTFSALASYGLSTNLIELQTATDGTTLNLWDGADTAVGGTNLVVGQWYHIALTYDGTTARSYVNGVADVLNARAITPGAEIWINGSPTATEWSNATFAALKIYTGVFTAAEIQNEIWLYMMQRTSGSNGWYPLLNIAEDETDFSGNGRTNTVGGTWATEDGPPIGW